MTINKNDKVYRMGICDDVENDRIALRENLIETASSIGITLHFSEYASAEELLDTEVQLDLLFLDIYMSGKDGMETARQLRANENTTNIVFLTTSPDFALESYEVTAFDYLLKPAHTEKLYAILERFLKVYRPRSILIQGKLFVVEDIVSAESQNKTVRFHFKDGTAAEITEKLDVVDAALASENFLRCHQSFVVNLDYVRGIEDCGFRTTLGTVILIRKREFSQIRKKYFEYITSF